MEEMPASSKLQKLRIRNKLGRVTPQQLKEIDKFMNSLLLKTNGDEKGVIHLKGTWKNSGLEKIADPEKVRIGF